VFAIGSVSYNDGGSAMGFGADPVCQHHAALVIEGSAGSANPVARSVTWRRDYYGRNAKAWQRELAHAARRYEVENTIRNPGSHRHFGRTGSKASESHARPAER
jgi:hypothetical protein